MKIVNKQEIEQQLECIGTGKCSNIYINEKEVYKILKEGSDSIRFYSKGMIEQLVGIKSELCVFPNEILEDEDGKILGYTMDIVPGDKIQKVIKKIPFEQLQEIIKRAQEGIREISEQGVIFDDMHYDNMMWNEETHSIQIIDTDFFKKSNEISIENINNTNLKKFASEIMKTWGLELNCYKDDNNEMKDFYESWLKNGTHDVNEYIRNLKNILENDFGRTFNNIEEMENALQERQSDIDEQQYKERIAKDFSIKEKLIRWVVQRKNLMKIPFISRIIEKQIKMLPPVNQEIINNAKNNNISQNVKQIQENEMDKTGREVFCDNLSNNGEYKNLPPIEQRNNATSKEENNQEIEK